MSEMEHVNKNEGKDETEIVRFCYDAFLGDGDFEEIQNRVLWNFDAASKTVSTRTQKSSVKPFTKKVYIQSLSSVQPPSDKYS